MNFMGGHLPLGGNVTMDLSVMTSTMVRSVSSRLNGQGFNLSSIWEAQL